MRPCVLTTSPESSAQAGGQGSWPMHQPPERNLLGSCVQPAAKGFIVASNFTRIARSFGVARLESACRCLAEGSSRHSAPTPLLQLTQACSQSTSLPSLLHLQLYNSTLFTWKGALKALRPAAQPTSAACGPHPAEDTQTGDSSTRRELLLKTRLLTRQMLAVQSRSHFIHADVTHHIELAWYAALEKLCSRKKDSPK